MKPVLVATPIKQAVCIKQACILTSQNRQIHWSVPVLSKQSATVLSNQILIILWCLLNTGRTVKSSDSSIRTGIKCDMWPYCRISFRVTSSLILGMNFSVTLDFFFFQSACLSKLYRTAKIRRLEILEIYGHFNSISVLKSLQGRLFKQLRPNDQLGCHGHIW